MLGLGKGRQALLAAAQDCQLLLIIGVSLKNKEIRDLSYDLGQVVREQYGGVVYIHPEPIQASHNTQDFIDFHLRTDALPVIDEIMQAMDRVSFGHQTSSSVCRMLNRNHSFKMGTHLRKEKTRLRCGLT
jgi:thiamine pyrophosphate-dependent acetolactate synthase large subunit-like protein